MRQQKLARDGSAEGKATSRTAPVQAVGRRRRTPGRDGSRWHDRTRLRIHNRSCLNSDCPVLPEIDLVVSECRASGPLLDDPVRIEARAVAGAHDSASRDASVGRHIAILMRANGRHRVQSARVPSKNHRLTRYEGEIPDGYTSNVTGGDRTAGRTRAALPSAVDVEKSGRGRCGCQRKKLPSRTHFVLPFPTHLSPHGLGLRGGIGKCARFREDLKSLFEPPHFVRT
jgi:hypothetical protein